MARIMVLCLLALSALTALVAGGPTSGQDASLEAIAGNIEQFQALFERAKAERRKDIEAARLQGAEQRAELQQELGQLQEARRLHTGNSLAALASSLQSSAYLAGNNTAGITANAAALAELAGATDHTWLILGGALVMFMQAGFAMVEAGCCRAKNVQNILMKNLVDVCVGTLCWWAVGWTLAYGIADGENHAFANSNQAFGTGFTEVTDDGIFTPSSTMLGWFFQWAFCSAAATIVSGGVAERVQFPGYLVFTIVMTSWIYPVVVHWTWGYGWLSGGDDYQINPTGFMDFAGSGIVHMCGGVGALVGATIVGPRKDRFEEPSEFVPHSMPLVVLGTFILWFGWYGFNCGSTLSMNTASTGALAAQVAMNTTISASVCGLVVLVLRFALLRKYDIGGLCNGILAGLVSITAPCGNVECGSALLIGIIGGFVYQGTSSGLQKIGIDDPIDAFAVHGACGAWGTLAAALFDWGTGTDYFNGWSGWSCVGAPDCTSGAFGEALAANIVEIIAISGWTAFFSVLVFLPLRVAGLLRAPDEAQAEGMDSAKHSPLKAYTNS